MTSAFAPPDGDPDALRSHGEALGRTAAVLADQTARVRRGTQLVELALLGSSSALRIDELRRGVRGLDHELEQVRVAGEQVADVVRDRAAALGRLRDDLAVVARQAQLDPSRLPSLRATADALRADHRRADQRAGETVARITATLTAHAAPVPTSRSVLAGADLTPDGAWLEVDGAYESIAAREHREEQCTVAYQALGFADGFGRAGQGTAEGLRDLVVHPVDAGRGFATLLHAVVTDPDGTARSTWQRVVDPYADDWHQREYGEAVGRGVEALAEVLVGTKGATRAGRLVVPGRTVAAGEDAAALAVRAHARALSRQISEGHAFDKHVLAREEFPGITTRSGFARLIESAVVDGEKHGLGNERLGYWKNGTIVIVDPKNADAGTAFRPGDGKKYFVKQTGKKP